MSFTVYSIHPLGVKVKCFSKILYPLNVFFALTLPFAVWGLFFFVLRCAFVVFRFLPMQYTGCTRRDAL
nr:MAG TPA: hypothetical protein [Caudoviricetes sp.]